MQFTYKNPDETELELIEYILRLGSSVPEKKIKIKCNHKKIDFDQFLKDWKPLIEIKIGRSEKIVTINDIDYAMNILKNSGRKLLSHHSQRSRRF